MRALHPTQSSPHPREGAFIRSTPNQPSGPPRGTDHTPHIPPTHGVHPPQRLHALPHQPPWTLKPDAASSEDESSTPYPVHLRGGERSVPPSPPCTPRTTRVPRNAPSPRAMSHHLGGPGQPPLHPVDMSHPLEKNTSAHIPDHLLHTRGVSFPEPGPLQHHIPMTHHTHPHSHPPENITHPLKNPHRTWTPFRVYPLPLPRGHTHPSPHPTPSGRAPQGAWARQTRDTHRQPMSTRGSTDHTHIHHKNSTVSRAPTASCTTTKHVLDESTRDPRVTSTQHHQSPCAAIDTRTAHRRQPHPRPKNTSAHHPTTRAHHVKPLTTVEKYTRIW